MEDHLAKGSSFRDKETEARGGKWLSQARIWEWQGLDFLWASVALSARGFTWCSPNLRLGWFGR